MATAKQPTFPKKIKNLLGDVHSIAKAKAMITKHGKDLELTGWYVDSDLRKRRQKLEVKILTILKEFQDEMTNHNWVEFIETTDAGHSVLMQHIDEIYDQMHAINEEYSKYTTFLYIVKNTKDELDDKSETLSSALNHMKFTEKNLHHLELGGYDSTQLRKAMYWDGWL